jgi:iron complex transport system permease protein
VGSSLVAKEPLPSLAVGAVPVATIGVVAHLAVNLLP